MTCKPQSSLFDIEAGRIKKLGPSGGHLSGIPFIGEGFIVLI